MIQLTLNIETKSLEKMIRSLVSNIAGVYIVNNSSKKDASKHATDEFIKNFYGAWTGDESADTIISNIKQDRISRPPVTLD